MSNIHNIIINFTDDPIERFFILGTKKELTEDSVKYIDIDKNDNIDNENIIHVVDSVNKKQLIGVKNIIVIYDNYDRKNKTEETLKKNNPESLILFYSKMDLYNDEISYIIPCINLILRNKNEKIIKYYYIQ